MRDRIKDVALDALKRWQTLPLADQTLYLLSAAAFLFFFLLYSTRWGRQGILQKCLLLALILHLLAWGYSRDVGRQELREPSRSTVRVQLAPSKQSQREQLAPDPTSFLESPSPPSSEGIAPSSQSVASSAPVPSEIPSPSPSVTAALDQPPAPISPPPLARAATPERTLAPPAPSPTIPPEHLVNLNPAPSPALTPSLSASRAIEPLKTPPPRIADETTAVLAPPFSRAPAPAPRQTESLNEPSRPTGRVKASSNSSTASVAPAPPTSAPFPANQWSDPIGRESNSLAPMARAPSSEPKSSDAPLTPRASVLDQFDRSREIAPVRPELPERAPAPPPTKAASDPGALSAPLAAALSAKQPWGFRAIPHRMEVVQRHGGSVATESAVADALRWLVDHQSVDGRWDSDGFMERCPRHDRCEGAAVEVGSDTGLTGLALLSLLGAGHTHRVEGIYRESVARGLLWLCRTQRDDGDLREGGRLYCHAMATLALTESWAMTRDEALRDAAQKAVDYLSRAQHQESGGWRYGPGEYGDTSVFGWALLALHSARSAGLRVSPAVLERARRWLPTVSSGPSGALASYQPGYEPSHAMTAEAMVCRQILGVPRNDPSLDAAGDYLLHRLPRHEDYHLYYWYYGTLGMFQLGGDYWNRWNQSLSATLIEHQSRQGHAKGSWEPRRPFGVDGGRIFATAASALCLEVYYRYLPLYGGSGLPPTTPRSANSP